MPSGNHKPASPKDRVLGAELKTIRLAAGLSLGDVCKAIGYNESTLSRVERGLRSISPELVAILAMVYKLPHARRDEMVARAKETPSLGWWSGRSDGIPALLSHEGEARQIVDCDPTMIPGLLQARGYIEAIGRDWGFNDEQIAEMTRIRLARQAMLDDPLFEYSALIGSRAIQTSFCTPENHVAQLHKLIRLSDRPNVTIRIVHRPTSLMFTAWHLMRFNQLSPVVHLEHYHSSTYLYDEETVPYTEIKRSLDKLALTEQATKEMIQAELEGILGSHHEVQEVD
ncbi:helix-turn-helix domain-containing protein [Actinokineospora inagensis]|uniref:helix-turn-helix domain-containing protein n=1 Tax=Actinokineospora inagensis TaxID=103730 RepID=UPI00047A8A57|nr:helix-turn-helix transcriptional regulator [Actinokineospora inagensis]